MGSEMCIRDSKVIERKEEEFQSNVVDDVMFVPLQEGIVS